MITFRNYLAEYTSPNRISMQHISKFEKVVDKLFKKFDIDFNFTRHFGDRMNERDISLKELAAFIQKIYKRQGKSIKGVKGAEAVLVDMQQDLNIPVAVNYNQRKDEFEVAMKTTMRKKNFRTRDKKIYYK